MADRIRLGRQFNDDSDMVIPLFRNKNGQRERVTSFESQEEMIKVMGMTDPKTGESLYEKSDLFRRSVEEIVANTPAETIGVQLEQRSPIPTDAEFLEGLRQDALRQQFERMVDQAGGNDAIAKYNMALMLTQPTEEQYQNFSEINQLTQLDAARPMENYLKARKASGLGPERSTVQLWDEHDEAYEEAKRNEALDFLASQDIGSSVDMGEEGVNI